MALVKNVYICTATLLAALYKLTLTWQQLITFTMEQFIRRHESGGLAQNWEGQPTTATATARVIPTTIDNWCVMYFPVVYDL